MLSEQIVSNSVVSYDDMFMNFTQQFLQSFQEIINSDFEKGTSLDLEIKGRSEKERINPIIRLATHDDIEEIIFIYKDIYDNTYPYKEMEDRDEIRKMLDRSDVEWLVFETLDHEIVGCFTFILDFSKKLGNIRGFNLKKKFLGKLDIMKMAMGSIIAMYKKYYDKIFRWYGECRTAHSKSQYFLSALGFKPVGFYPCKDVFYNDIESDLLIVSYDKRALTTMRSEETPNILSEALNGFLYSDKRYHLGPCNIMDSTNLDLKLNNHRITELQKNLSKHVSKDRFGYEFITFSFKNSNSFFRFLYTPTVQNFEKTDYEVNCLEELYVFLQEFLEYGKIYNIRYCEAFISAYKPSHQKLFSDFGLRSRGYVPSWKYNKEIGKFEDCILFNWYDGDVKNMQLLEEGNNLLEILGIQYSYENNRILERNSPVPVVSSLEERFTTKIFTRAIKSSILTGLIIYLSLLFSSLSIASLQGYKITTNTISELALSTVSPVPFLFDISCILGGLISVLFYFHLSKKIKKLIKFNFFIKYSMISGLVGSIGIIFVGICSLERAHLILHGIFTLLAFGGFIISISTFSLKILRYNRQIPKFFIINGILPLMSLFLYFILITPLTEWIMLLSIIFSLIPLFCWNTFQK